MEGRESKTTKPRRKTLKRIIQVISGLFLFLVIFIVFAVPAILSSGKVRQIILSKINASGEGKAGFSDLSIGWLSGVRIADFSYDDKADWISVKVKNISTKPHYGALLAGNYNFGKTQIDTPQVVINMKNKPPADAAQPPAESKNAPSEPLQIVLATDIRLNDGSVKLTGTDSKTVELAQINSDVSIRPPGKQSSFNLGMVVAANNEKSPVEVKGNVTPDKKSGWSIEGADWDIGINVGDLDLESIEPFLEMAGVEIQTKGSISVDIQSKVVGGQLESASGTIKGSNLEIDNSRTKEKIKTSVLDAEVKLSQKGQMINIDKMQLKTDWAGVQASGAVPTTIKSLDSFLGSGADYDLSGTFNCDLAAVASQLPMTLGLKENMKLTSGKITGEIKTTGATGQKQIQAQAELADLKGIVDGKQAAISAPIVAKALISPDKSGVNIKNLAVSSSFMNINAAGNLEQIKFDGQADLSRLQSELSQFVDIGPYKLEGQFIEKGQVSLNDKNVQLTGSSTIKGLNITGPNNVTASMQAGDVTYTLNLDRQKNVLNANSMDADTDFGRVNIVNAVVPLGTEFFEGMNVAVNARQINLGKLKPFAVLFAGMPENIELAGIAESQVSVTSQKKIFTAKSDSTKLQNLKVVFPGRKPLERSEATAIFDVKLDAEQMRLKSVFFRLNSPGLNITQANINQTEENGKVKLTGQAELDYDWAVLSTVVGQFLPEELQIKGQRKDKINFASEYPVGRTDKLLDNLNATAGFGFQQAEYMGLDFGATDVKIDVTKGMLQIAPFSTVVNEGKLNFGVMADFKKQPVLFEMTKPMQIIQNIQVNDKTTKKLLKYLNPIFANASNVSGIANLSCDKLGIPISSAAKNDALIEGIVSMTQLRLQTSDLLGQIINIAGGNETGVVITIHPTKFTLKDGVLSYDNMEMDVDKYPVNFAGSIGLDKSLNMTVTLPYTLEGKTIRTGQQNRDRITLPLTGTVDKPGIDLQKFLELQLKGGLEEQLRKGLENIFK